MGKVPWSVAAFLILLLFAVRTAAQAGACGPQPINPCATYECVAGHWKVSPRVGACTVGGQSGTCEAGSCAVVGAFKINVVVYGLSTGNSLVLLQGNSSKLSVTKNGSYSFPGVFGQPYSVTVQTQPAGQSCAVGSNGSGNLSSNVNVVVECLSTSSWTPVGPAPVALQGPGQGGDAGRVSTAIADPTNAAVIYLGTAGGGIWKTVNAVPGISTPVWQPLTDAIAAAAAPPSNLASLQTSGAHSLSVHPANHNLIQAAVYYSGAGVLQSSQAGAPGSWSLLGNSQFDHWGIWAIAVHPTKQQVAYVATDHGLYQTTNGGQNWTQVGGGLPTTGLGDVIFPRYDPNGNTIFVTVPGNSGTAASLNGIYRSTDGGISWTLLGALPNSALSHGTWPNVVQGGIQIDSGSSGILYASMLTVGTAPPAQPCGSPPPPPGWQVDAVQRFRSSDDGNTWTLLKQSPGGLEGRSSHQLIAVDPRKRQSYLRERLLRRL